MLTELPGIAGTVARIKSGDLSPLDMVDACLAQIDRFEARVRAWVLVDAEGARRQAARIAESLAQDGGRRGERPLLGIPIGIKDIVDVAGMPTLAGSPLRKGHVASDDAPLVAHLRHAGAIILGKTVTTEFAGFDPPSTRNPWNLQRTPGGSSSGSAAAVALGMCLAAVGSQTGGSITRPASYCGVAGLKPTRGLVSLDGVVPISFTLDHPGPIARSVDDLRRMLAGMTGEPLDASPPHDSAAAPPSFYRLGGFFDELCDGQVRQTLDAACERLSAAGAPIERLALPESFSLVHRMHRRIMAAEAAEYHRRQFAAHRASYGPQIAALVEEGLALSAIDYVEALQHRHVLIRDFEKLLGDGVALVPAATSMAPTPETTGNPAFNSPLSYAGVPAVNIPCGLAGDGMPCGLQLVALAGREHDLLEAAAWCERQLAFRARPPLD